MNFHLETYIQLCMDNPSPSQELQERISKLGRLIKVVFNYNKMDLEMFVAESRAYKARSLPFI